MRDCSEKLIILRRVRNPKVSVIVPTYNEEKYIEKTLYSIKHQKFTHKFEIIVSDSNSTDRTIGVAKKYADKIVITNRKGIAVGRNVGAKYAEGDVFIFVDADTILMPHTLREVYKIIKKKDVSLVAVRYFSRENSQISNFYFFISYIYLKIFYFILKIAHVPGFFIACKKNDFLKVGGFNENLKALEDFDLSKKLSKLGKVEFVDKVFVLTSSRRIDKWNIMAIPKYLSTYFHFLLFGNDGVGRRFWKEIIR